jgi:hypothetical protein
MKLKDFLKQFENEDPEIEIVQQTKDHYRDLEKDIDIEVCYVPIGEIEKEVITKYYSTNYKYPTDVKVIKIG